MSGFEDTGSACAACGAALAADQRYCVECGERRGRSELPFDPAPVVYDDPPAPASRGSRWQMSSGGALIGGIGVLLLALGVGVLIGKAGNASATKSPPVQVVTVASGGAAPAAAAGTPSGTTGAAVAPSAAAGAAAGAGAASGAAASPAHASNVSSSTTSTSTATVRAETTRPLTGPNRPGYHNGKFTGNFFGP
jgi:hypothetical protein